MQLTSSGREAMGYNISGSTSVSFRTHILIKWVISEHGRKKKLKITCNQEYNISHTNYSQIKPCLSWIGPNLWDPNWKKKKQIRKKEFPFVLRA